MSRTTANWIGYVVAVVVVALGARVLLGPQGLTINGAVVLANLVLTTAPLRE